MYAFFVFHLDVGVSGFFFWELSVTKLFVAHGFWIIFFICFLFCPVPNQYILPYMDVSCGMELQPTQLSDNSRMLLYYPKHTAQKGDVWRFMIRKIRAQPLVILILYLDTSIDCKKNHTHFLPVVSCNSIMCFCFQRTVGNKHCLCLTSYN